jgi:hypothetical protein
VATLFVMILTGHLNLDKMFVSRNWMMIVLVACFMGIASIHFVKLVVVSIHFFHVEDGGFISPMKSKPHCMNGASNEIDFSGRGYNFLLPSKI